MHTITEKLSRISPFRQALVACATFGAFQTGCQPDSSTPKGSISVEPKPDDPSDSAGSQIEVAVEEGKEPSSEKPNVNTTLPNVNTTLPNAKKPGFVLEDLKPAVSAFLLAASEIPECEERNLNQLIFNDDIKQFTYCTTDGWKTLEISDFVTESGKLPALDASQLTNLPAADPVLGGELSGTASSAVVVRVGGKTAAEVSASVNDTDAAADTNLPSTIVKRNSDGDISVQDINVQGTISGNGSGITNLSAAQITLGGDLSGAGNSASVATVGGKTAAEVAGSVDATTSATHSNSASTLVRRDGSGSISVGTVNATAFVGDGSGLTNVGMIGVRDQSRNLSVTRNDTNANSEIKITADELMLQNSAGVLIRVTGVSEVFDITASGVGGLDTGSEAGGTWYHVWIISDGTNVEALGSTSATSPSLPSGYTYVSHVSTVFNDAGSNLRDFFQRGRKVRYNSIGNSAVLSSGSTNTWIAQDLSDELPPNVKSGFFKLQCDLANTVAPGIGVCELSVDGTNPIESAELYFDPTEEDRSWSQISFDVPVVDASQQVWLRRDGANRKASLWVQGFSI